MYFYLSLIKKKKEKKAEYQAKEHDPFLFRQALSPMCWEVSEAVIQKELILGHSIHPATKKRQRLPPSDEMDMLSKLR